VADGAFHLQAPPRKEFPDERFHAGSKYRIIVTDQNVHCVLQQNALSASASHCHLSQRARQLLL